MRGRSRLRGLSRVFGSASGRSFEAAPGNPLAGGHLFCVGLGASSRQLGDARTAISRAHQSSDLSALSLWLLLLLLLPLPLQRIMEMLSSRRLRCAPTSGWAGWNRSLLVSRPTRRGGGRRRFEARSSQLSARAQPPVEFRVPLQWAARQLPPPPPPNSIERPPQVAPGRASEPEPESGPSAAGWLRLRARCARIKPELNKLPLSRSCERQQP